MDAVLPGQQSPDDGKLTGVCARAMTLMTAEQHLRRAEFYSRSNLPKAAELARLHRLVAKVLQRPRIKAVRILPLVPL